MDSELNSGPDNYPTHSQSRAIRLAKMRSSTEGQEQRKVEGCPSTPTCKTKLKKGLWSPDEDNKLTTYIMRKGLMGCWSYVAEQAGLQRCGKSCRLRWINYLRPGLKRGAFSRQEERQIIHLQSILGNRWSQIAAHLRGRTDNEIKNYWNSCIKKKIKSKNHIYFTKSDTPSQAHRFWNPNSVFVHGHGSFTSSQTDQPYLDVIPEGYQTPNNTFSEVTTGGSQNQFSVLGVLESIHEQGHDQNHKFSIETDPTNNQLFSCSHLGIDSTSTRTHDTVSTHAFIDPSLQAQGHDTYDTAKQIDSWTWTASTLPLPREAEAGYTITVPDLTESQLKANFENDIDDKLFKENEIMIDYSPFTASPGISGWSASNIAADCSHVVDPGASQFSAQPAWQFNDFLFDGDYRDRLNLGYDLDLGVCSYSYLLSQIEGGGSIGD